MPTEPEPIAQVNTGMLVVDAAGAEVGTVSDVRMPDEQSGEVPDLPPAEADRLSHHGFLRVDAAGLLERDAYVAAEQIAEVSETDGGRIVLTVTADQLVRAG